MDTRLVDATATRCLICRSLLRDRHRVALGYNTTDLFYAQAQLDIGVMLNVRILYKHVDCADPELTQGVYRVIPTIENCIRCKQKIRAAHIIQPVYQVTAVDVVNPTDPTDKGIELGERIHFVHIDCGSPTLLSNGSLLV